METDEDVQEVQKISKQQKYAEGLSRKGLLSARVVIPKNSEAELRRWAKEEREALKSGEIDIPCIDDPSEDPRNVKK